MSDFDYKKYSLEQLDNWIHDAMSCEDATPQEIYDVIVGVVKENYYYHKDQASRAYELLCKLNGDKLQYTATGEKVWVDDYCDASGLTEPIVCNGDDLSPECQKSWDDFWENVDKFADDKVVRWKLPVQVDGLTGDCYVQFPDDLLEASNLQEGDQVQWIDNGDGSFTLKKVTQPLRMDEC